MNIQLKVSSGTDKTIRLDREIFTKVADKLFNNSYLVGKDLIGNIKVQ